MSHTKIHSRSDRARWRRKNVIRKRIRGTAERPRLSVFRSRSFIYVQAIDDDSQQVVAAASDREKEFSAAEGQAKKDRAKLVGQNIAQRLKEKNVSSAVFDRNGYIYHGRVQQVAEGAREGGLEF